MYVFTCAQSCLTLCNLMECSPPGSSVHGIFQARILEWPMKGYSNLLFDHWNLFLWKKRLRGKKRKKWQCFCYSKGFPGGSEVKTSAFKCRRPGFDPWVRKIPWRRKWQPTPIFLPGESHGWRSLATVHGVAKSRTRLSDLTFTFNNFVILKDLFFLGNQSLLFPTVTHQMAVFN